MRMLVLPCHLPYHLRGPGDLDLSVNQKELVGTLYAPGRHSSQMMAHWNGLGELHTQPSGAPLKLFPLRQSVLKPCYQLQNAERCHGVCLGRCEPVPILNTTAPQATGCLSIV